MAANDKIQIALIGCGGMGQGDARNQTLQPNTKLVAACDIYQSRLEHMRELYGPDTYTTRDYREVLARKDVDAVLIATPDHWHARITTEALQAGKHVYCQKPMVKRVDEGLGVIAAEKASGKVLQVGSQYVSSHVFLKARELFQQGALGELNLVEAWLDRNTAMGAWQYSIPVNLQQSDIDWDRFLGNAPKRPFEPIRLFRWRNYGDYGTGVAGDLFIHLLSGLHTVVGSIGPTTVFASGGVRYWKDGRDAPDVMLAVLDYPKSQAHPAFTLALRVNLASGVATEQFGFRFVGSEGIMTAAYNTLRLEKHTRETAPGYSIGTLAQKDQDAFLADYRKKYPPSTAPIAPDSDFKFTAQADAHRLHHQAFAESIRGLRPPVEDATFGFRAAAPALLCNESAEKGQAFRWDPVTMRRS
ncbi:Gfo/Idh/MocA family protein [Bryobacter aggregatus]|uniref:Gfo/Idh/MocA family protein n=1 Tax=Bryobacter aggregatus TaxID=360054 RepID=UPI0004E1C309|nr:Gfo/Idh/MocA family oxidoreductase [Bryobacter aggregatus]